LNINLNINNEKQYGTVGTVIMGSTGGRGEGEWRKLR
jgi:hypothetical protein